MHSRFAKWFFPKIDAENSQTRCALISTDNELCVPLTVKEKEVLALLAKGFSNDEISAELHITVGTVKSHMNNLFGKLEVNSRSKVVAKGLELGLIKT
ncbi:response regulator transcription factor [Propionispora vibrioides]|uniref:Regulatory protein, luxR family n=1 Tax=Propionispora vibrioides TaxID=112903 RepID=A0A1H8U785_9FIRM|nr:LuxR C-terminal-related transcriptional regulator [Propionispora vibrioides]SEO99015.1 regulatory protein, luxR family [Propionispora vibrioides]